MLRKYLLFSMFASLLVLASGCGIISKGKEAVEEVVSDAEGDVEEQQAEADQQGEEETDNSKEPGELGDYEVAFNGEVEETEDSFIIDGKTNLLPESRLVGEVIVTDEDDEETVFSDTSELVAEDGTFHMEMEHHQYGEAEIIIRFDFDNVQEDEIKRHYGEKGQKLEGPFIYKHKTYDGILKKAEVKIPYEANGGNELAIQAPDWEETPEDYGDPRVWIEVDELTEDGEYFYMHGRSNLLEGSELRVAYKYNKDTTQVNPDGSFDFQFDYEYLEDKDIVITFKPADFQWNEIEEAYGKTGQKLVGNLVKTNEYNTDKQYVEKRIEWDSEASKMKSDSVNEKRDQEDAKDTDPDAQKEEEKDGGESEKKSDQEADE